MTDKLVRKLKPCDNPKVLLVCFPHAGGAATFFGPLAQELSPDIEVRAIQYPGRQDRRLEHGPTDLLSFSLDIHRALRQVLPDDVPIALLGNSMGTILAFEVARMIMADPGSLNLKWLILAGRGAVSQIKPQGRVWSDEELILEVTSRNGTDKSFLENPDLLEMILPALRSDYQALEQYKYIDNAPPLNLPILALFGKDDPRVSEGVLAYWNVHTSKAFEVKACSGGHFFMQTDVKECGQLIRPFLS